jgi:PHP family Zn ribbon phosphoesterase
MPNLNPEQFKNESSSKDSPKMVAKCGHEDPLGYFAGTVCGKCARKNHKKAMGK